MLFAGIYISVANFLTYKWNIDVAVSQNLLHIVCTIFQCWFMKVYSINACVFG